MTEESLKSVVINFASFPIYVNFAHLFVLCFSLYLVLVNLSKIEGSYLLLYKICLIVLFCLSLLGAIKLYVFILLIKYHMASCFCSCE